MSIINLLPEDYIEGRLRRRANVLCLGLFVVVMVGVVAATFVSRQSARYTREVEERVRQDYEEAAKLIEQMQQLEREKQRLHDKALATAPLMERIPRSTLLAVLAQSLPGRSCITRLELETKREEPKAPLTKTGGKDTKFAKLAAERVTGSPTIVSLRITGLADTDVEVARFIANMARNPLLKTVDLVYSQEKKLTKEQPMAREFQLKAELQQNADAIDLPASGFGQAGAVVQQARGAEMPLSPAGAGLGETQ